MPTISDLKDQARTLEQQGQIDRALTIYEHILKHLEGTPAILKVLPLYVKAGDLRLKLGRTEDAVASYQSAADHYAEAGAAPRVTALCGKIIRLAPDRPDVYTSYVRKLVEHGHVGSARDVLSEYARLANMDRAVETLDDLAGRPNDEVQPMLENLLESFEMDEQSELTAARVSSQLEQVTDDLAGELSGVPEPPPQPEPEPEPEPETAEPTPTEPEDETGATREEPVSEETQQVDEADEEDVEDSAPEEESRESSAEPLTPPMLDLDHLPRQSTLGAPPQEADETEAEETEEEEHEVDEEAPESEAPEAVEITTDVSPTMEEIRPTFLDVEDVAEVETSLEETAAEEEEEETEAAVEGEEEPSIEDSADDEDTERESGTPSDQELDLLLAEAMQEGDVEVAEEDQDTIGATGERTGLTIEGSEWTPDDESEAVGEVVEEEAFDDEGTEAAGFADDGVDVDYSDEETVGADAGDEEQAVEAETGAEEVVEEEVAAEWKPEEDLKPAARYPSDEYDAPETDGEDEEEEEEVESEAPAAVEEEAPVEAATVAQPAIDEEPPTEPERRPTRPPRMMVPETTESSSKSPVLFGIIGFVVGALVGAGATFMFVGGSGGEGPQEPAEEQPAAVADTTPAALQQDPAPMTPDEQPETQPDDEAETDAPDATPATPVIQPPASDTSAAEQEEAAPTGAEDPAPVDEEAADTVVEEATAPATDLINPIVVEGLEIEEIEEVESDGRAGYRVVHPLDWADPLVIEAYRDTSVSMSTFVQVTVTPPDTVVGIRRLDGYMVYTSGIMPEDSLRSLMSRLVEGTRPN